MPNCRRAALRDFGMMGSPSSIRSRTSYFMCFSESVYVIAEVEDVSFSVGEKVEGCVSGMRSHALAQPGANAGRVALPS